MESNLAKQVIQENSVYYLDSKKLVDALAILEKELDVFGKFVQVERETAPRVKLTMDLSSIVFVSVGIVLNHEWVSGWTALVTGVLIYAGYFLAVFLSNREGIRASRRLRKTQKSLGLESEKGFVGWKEFKKRLPAAIVTLLLFILSLVLFFAFLDSPLYRRWLIDLSVIVLMLSSMRFFSVIARRNLMLLQRRLASASQLRDTLEQATPTDKYGQYMISIPEAEYKQIARIERALINLERQSAISRAAKSSETGLAVQQSNAVLKAKSELAPAARIKVQTTIDELSTNYRPADSRLSPDGDWRLPVAETAWEISYALAENPPRILIRDLLKTNQV
jgi:hypothetical protein